MDESTTRTRRSVLAAGAGALAATVAAAARPLPTLAGSDGDVVLGTTNTAVTPTTITNSADGDALIVNGKLDDQAPSTAITGHGNIGVVGEARYVGVRGTSETFAGVVGEGPAFGVEGSSPQVGVSGASSRTGVGVLGQSAQGNGVQATVSEQSRLPALW